MVGCQPVRVTKMLEADDTTTFYRYPISQKIITYVLMPLASLVGIGLGVFLLRAENTIIGTFLATSGALFIFLSAFGSLMCSSIAVNDKGIAAHNYGRTLKFVQWRDVTKIKKVKRWNAGSRSYEDVFHVFDGEFPALRERMVNLRGPIVFTDQIRDLRKLLDRINEYSRRYHFLLVTLDQEAARKLAVEQGARVVGEHCAQD
jgi:hypothetical protein